MNDRTGCTARGAVIAAAYIILTFISNMFGLSGGIIQVRLSEALTILPVFTPAAVPGLFIGCLISNILTGCALPDVIFGSLATLAGAALTLRLSKHPLMASLPPIIVNTAVIPFILSYVYSFEGSIFYFMITIFIGELVSAGILSQCLRKTLEKYSDIIHW